MKSLRGRSFAVVAAAAAILAALVPSPGRAEELAPGVHLLPGAFVEGRQPDGNTVVFTAPAGLVVVDTGRHPAHTQGILDLAATLRQPVAAILNTHWHLDHIGGNARVREVHPGARLHATAAIADARTGFLASYRAQLESLIADPQRPAGEKEPFRAELARIDGSAAIAADVVVAEGAAPAAVAGRPLELHVAEGATKGDLWLLDRASGVLVAGDLVTLPAPFFDTACPSAWQASLDRLAAAEFRTLVPGHGPPLDRAGFERYRTAFGKLVACAGSQRPGEECTAGWLADAGSLVPAADHQLARNLLGYYLDQVLRNAERAPCA